MYWFNFGTLKKKKITTVWRHLYIVCDYCSSNKGASRSNCPNL